VKIRTASLTHRQAGSFLTVEEYPLHVLLAEEAGEWLAGVALHRVVCCFPGFLWNIHWGKPEADPTTADSEGDRYYPHNAGRYLHGLGTWMIMGFGTWRKAKKIAEVPVTPAWVREHYPTYGYPFDGSCTYCQGYQDVERHEENGITCRHRLFYLDRIVTVLRSRSGLPETLPPDTGTR
jgi:hypothetical protein